MVTGPVFAEKNLEEFAVRRRIAVVLIIFMKKTTRGGKVLVQPQQEVRGLDAANFRRPVTKFFAGDVTKL